MNSPCINCSASPNSIVCKYNGEWMSEDQYKARLKDDMIDMLTELKTEIEALPTDRIPITDSFGLTCYEYSEYEPTAKDASKIIQQKIDSLKAESNK